jgi:hypothetical protein
VGSESPGWRAPHVMAAASARRCTPMGLRLHLRPGVRAVNRQVRRSSPALPEATTHRLHVHPGRDQFRRGLVAELRERGLVGPWRSAASCCASASFAAAGVLRSTHGYGSGPLPAPVRTQPSPVGAGAVPRVGGGQHHRAGVDAEFSGAVPVRLGGGFPPAHRVDGQVTAQILGEAGSTGRPYRSSVVPPVGRRPVPATRPAARCRCCLACTMAARCSSVGVSYSTPKVLRPNDSR